VLQSAAGCRPQEEYPPSWVFQIPSRLASRENFQEQLLEFSTILLSEVLLNLTQKACFDLGCHEPIRKDIGLWGGSPDTPPLRWRGKNSCTMQAHSESMKTQCKEQSFQLFVVWMDRFGCLFFRSLLHEAVMVWTLASARPAKRCVVP
jgi:hypothetical protein